MTSRRGATPTHIARPARRSRRVRCLRAGWRGTILALVLVAASAASTLAQTIAEIDVDGNKTTEESLIRSRFPLTVGDRYNAAIAREGIKDLYALGLFKDITILTDPLADGRIRILLRVAERDRIASIRFSGNEHIDTDDLNERIALAKGQLLDPATVAAAKREVEKAFREKGYPLAAVEVQTTPAADGRVTITFDVDEGERVRLKRISFLGNSHFEEDELRGEMKTKPKGFLRSGKFEQEKFDEDLERIAAYYHDNGYRDAEVAGYEVSHSADHRDMFVAISVDEGPLYTMGEPTWHGNEAVPDEVIDRAVSWESGAPYSASQVQGMASTITEAFTERGFLLGFDVDVKETVIQDHRVETHYTITEGEPSKVGEIRIVGNTRTKEKVIRRELAIYPGQVFRRSALMRSQREVFSLGYFDDVRVDFLQSDPTSNDIDIEFDVEERRLGTAGAGMGFSSATGVTGFLQIGHNNLFGNGWDMSIHLERGSRRSQYELSFTEPWFLDRPISLGVELFDTEISRDVFDDHRRGASLTVGWPFPGLDYTRAFATASFQNVDIPFIDSSISAESRQRLLDATGNILSLRVGASRNTTDNPFYPTSGTRSQWSSEFSGGPLGGTIDFQKHIVETRSYFRPFWKPTVMFRGRVGAVLPYTGSSSDVPGYETFRLGGTLYNYLRGYDDYEVVPEENITTDSLGRESRFPGGKYMATFTMEYQFPVAHPLHGLVFLDMGDTWNDLNDISLNGFKRGAGAGLRMEVPMLGILGLDYAYGFDREGGARWKPHLIFGRQF